MLAGVDTEGAKLENEWKKIENRIQISRENIEASNVTAAEASAQKAVAEWNSAVIQAEIDARNAVWDFAKKLGLKYFMVCDDDYMAFEYRIAASGGYYAKKNKKC